MQLRLSSDTESLERYLARVSSRESGTPAGQRVGSLMVAISGIGFGTLSVFSRSALATGLTVPQMLCLRFLGGAIVLWLFALARKEVSPLPVRQVLGFALMGTCFVGEAWLYFESSQRIPVALTALLLYVFPALVVVASWLFFGSSPGLAGLAALVLSTLGIGLAVGGIDGAIDGVGVALGLGAAVSYAGYILLGARRPLTVSPSFGSALLMSMAALLFGAISAVNGGLSLSPLGTAWPSLLGIVGLGTVLPIPLLLLGMARIGPARASIISTLEPVTSAVCGVLFLNEGLGPLQVVGAGLVVAGACVAALARR
jgi:drug/metabolite transporter (DMT)-like permease